jgi:Asp-tRNA(Asn)/Glu-tRNA(Gln) amidotransferase C subunit
MINEIDVKDIKFTKQVNLQNVFRDDRIKPSLSQEKVISSRKKSSKDGYFTISSVFDRS